MARSFTTRIPYTRPGDGVIASVVAAPDRALANNLQYLKERLDAAELGRALVWNDVAVTADTVVGTPVAWNSTIGRFEPALAVAEVTEEGTAVASTRSHVAGIVLEKPTSATANLLVLGIAELSISDVSTTTTDGLYYLSGQTAGKITKTRPAVGLPILQKFGNYVCFTPAFRDFAEDHVHFEFELVAAPAGDYTPPSLGNRHTISVPDSSRAGWLPADDAIFNGLAPEGAAFGYNLSAHAALQNTWPPIPITAAAVFWDKGQDHLGATQVPTGATGLVVLDKNGIWWMSDCYGDVPWPIDYVEGASLSSETLECPRTEQMRVVLSFIRMSFATNRSVVTSLKVVPGSKLVITNCDGDPADVGDLQIADALELLVDTTVDVAGSRVVKELRDEDKTFTTGHVTEGLIAGAGVTLSSTQPKVVNTTTIHRGTVTVNMTAAAQQELTPDLIRLFGAAERFDHGVLYVSLIAGTTTSVRTRVCVPASVEADTTARLQVVLIATKAGTTPEVTLTVQKVAAVTDPTALPTAETTVAFVADGLSVDAFDYFTVTSDEFTVTGGDIVFYTLERASDAYAGELGILRSKIILG